MNPLRRVAVIGAGLMGHGIAQVFAVAGHAVGVFDPSPAARASLQDRVVQNLRALGQDEAPARRIIAHDALERCVGDADYVVETALEDPVFKQEMFAAIEQAAPREAVFASNTSVIPIATIMARLVHPERALGTHWWNPPYLIPLVEVIPTDRTAPEVVEAVMALHRAIGKVAVRVARDVPGFIGNRLQHALWREAIALVQEGICDAETVDTVVKASFGRRLGVLGPLENADLVGTDLTLAIHRTLLPALDRTPGPLPYLEQLVRDGRLGMKSGQGFRSWDGAGEARLRRLLTQTLRRAAEEEDVADGEIVV